MNSETETEDGSLGRFSKQTFKGSAAPSLTTETAEPSAKSHPSHTSQTSDISNTSYTELVSFNKEGHPYIDINRLIYRPAIHHHHHHLHHLQGQEKFSWYAPDFAFIVFNIVSLCVSTHFFLIGATTLTWKSSVAMFSVPPCWELVNDTSTSKPEWKKPADRFNSFYYLPCRRFTLHAGQDFSASKGYNFHRPNTFPILRTKLTDVHYFGLFLICIELLNVLNVIVGINACLHGYKALLIQHIAVDGCIVLGEFIISAIVTFTSVCDIRDLNAVRVLLANFVHWYGTIMRTPEDESDKDKLIDAELDSLQIGLGCCGVDSWIDYLAARFPESDWYQSRTHLDEAEMVIPNSCCRSWWIRNVYCSHGAHLWAHPLASEAEADRFQERIVQEGCLYKLEKLCDNLRSWMGPYGFYAMFIHLFFVMIEAFAAVVLIRNINRLIRENKKLMRKREMVHDSSESGSELEFTTEKGSITSKDGKPRPQWATVPPPTEDEIMTIRQRTHFNDFMSRVKGGYVGKWMNEAQELVMEGYEEVEEDITAEERKQREKELLHGAKKQQREQEEAARYGQIETNEKIKKSKAKKAKPTKGAKKKPEHSLELSPSFDVLWQRNQTAEETDKPPETEESILPTTTDGDEDTSEEEEKRHKRKRRRRRRKKKKSKLTEKQPWFKHW